LRKSQCLAAFIFKNIGVVRHYEDAYMVTYGAGYQPSWQMTTVGLVKSNLISDNFKACSRLSQFGQEN
jgi:hypothetical protein